MKNYHLMSLSLTMNFHLGYYCQNPQKNYPK